MSKEQTIPDSFFERLERIIRHNGGTLNNFSEQAGFSSGALSKILNGKKSFGIDKLFNILSAFPLLNPVWLLLGKGPQYLEGGFDYQSLTQQVNAQEIEILRLKAKLEVYEDLIKYRTTQHPPKDEE